MSHIVSIKTRLTDTVALFAACQRLGLAPPVAGSVQLYSAPAPGLIIHLPGWHYPVVVDTTLGQVQFDNFEGHWGSPTELDKLLQAYAVEKARIEARRMGHSLSEHTLSDGSIKLTIQVGAGFGTAGPTAGAGGAL